MAIPKGPDLEYVRGDMVPISIIFKRNKVPVSFAGYTDFQLTVNSTNEPVNTDDQIAQFGGTLTAIDGTIDFEPADQAQSDALVPEVYFYDVQALDAAGKKVTLLLGGNFTVKQDINKG